MKYSLVACLLFASMHTQSWSVASVKSVQLRQEDIAQIPELSTQILDRINDLISKVYAGETVTSAMLDEIDGMINKIEGMAGLLPAEQQTEFLTQVAGLNDVMKMVRSVMKTSK